MAGIEDEAIKEWSVYLAGLTGEQIKHGLEAWDLEWPPTLPEFRNICKQSSGRLHETYAPLPAPKTDPEKIKEHIAEMRKLNGG